MFSLLYVDDEPDLCDLTRLFLGRSGEFVVDTAGSAQEALGILRSRHYDAIISDYQMPEMDGIAFLKTLRAGGNRTPFIIFTGRGREEIVIEALNSGADFYLQKGGDPESQFAELRSKVQQAVSRRRAEERVAYLSRINSLISHVNKNIVRTSDRRELFQTICDVAIEQGKFRMAWIGLVDRKAKLIRPVAWAGDHAGEYLDGIIVSTEDVPEGRGPTARAAREEKPVIINTIQHDPSMHPWREKAAEFGYQASGGFPLRCRESVIGVLSIYAAEPDFFSEEEIALLEEVCADISYALANLESEKERIRAEESLSASEEKYRSILENIQDVYYRMDREGVVVMVSPSGAALLGYAGTGEITGRPALDFFSDRREAEKFLALLKRDGRVSDFEAVVTRKDGSRISISGSSHVLFDAGGNYAGAEGIFHDITARKAAEDALRQSEEKNRHLAEIVESSDDAIIGKTLDGIITSWNRGAERIYGYTASEIMGRSLTVIIPPDRKDELSEILDRIRRGVHVDHYETTRVRKDGEEIAISLTVSPIRGEDGTIVGASTIARDITIRKEAEERLQQQLGFLQQLIDTIPNPVFYKNAEGVYTGCNKAFEDYIGLPRDRIIGKSVYQISPKGLADQYYVQDKSLLDHPGMQTYEAQVRYADGSFRDVVFYKATYADIHGHVEGLVGLILDITKRKQAEDVLRLQNRIFETIAEGVYLIRVDDGTIVFTNDKFDRMFGYGKGEIIGRHVSVVNAPHEGTTARDIADRIIQALSETGNWKGEIKNIRKDGTTFWSLAVVSTFDHPQFGKTWISAHTDITERKAAEEGLKESEKRYRDLFEINDAIMLIIDPESGKIVDANESACQFYGYTREELTGLVISQINTQDPKDTRTDMTRARGSHGAVFQFRHRKKDGEVREVEVFSGPIVVKGRTLLHSIIQDVTERVRAEEVLRESEARYRNLFVNMLEGFAYCRMIYDADGAPADFIYLDVNPSFDRIIGTKTVTGKNVTEVFPGIKEAFPELFETYGRVASTGQPASFDLEFSPVGKWLHISVYSPRKDHFVAVFEDITARRLAEEEIKKAEEKYRTIFETALEGIYQISPKGKLLTANPAMARILGYDSPGEMTVAVTDTARQLWANQDQRRQYLRELREHDVVRDFECEFLRRDGSTIWVSLTTHTIRNAAGKILVSEGILGDITLRKAAERELIEREQEYRTILRTAMDGFCIISPDGRFVDVNDAFCRMTGYSRDELSSMSIAGVEAKETADMVREHAREILRKGEDRFETQYRRKDGSIIDVEVSVVATSRHGGQFITFHHDITQRKQAQAEVESARSTLEQKVLDRTRELKHLNESLQAEIALRNKAENEIVASLKEKELLLKEIHHRVKNNMQVISSLLFMQARAQKDQAVREILKESQDRIRSIALVHEKLYQSADLDRIDYTDYLQKITSHLFESYQVDPGRIALHLTAEHAFLHIDKAVPCSLIINEMLSNSLKHAFPGGRKGEISIDFKKEDTTFILVYHDNGVGIPEGVTFDRKESLGMQLIGGLTKQLGGTIRLDRTGGTTYTVIFPA